MSQAEYSNSSGTEVVHLHPAVKREKWFPDGERAASMARAEALAMDLARCLQWLIKRGIYVCRFAGWRGDGVDRVTVRVAASPLLHHLFGDECCWQERRQEGALTIYTWFAHVHGIRVEWEEVCL